MTNSRISRKEPYLHSFLAMLVAVLRSTILTWKVKTRPHIARSLKRTLWLVQNDHAFQLVLAAKALLWFVRIVAAGKDLTSFTLTVILSLVILIKR